MITVLTLLALAPAEPIPALCAAVREIDPDGRSESTYVSGLDGYLFRLYPDLAIPPAQEPAAMALLSRFGRELEARGTTLVLAPVPPRGMVMADKLNPADPLFSHFDPVAQRTAWDRSLADLRATGVRVADMNQFPAAGPFNFKRDHHWTPDGARAGGKAVAAAIADLPIPRHTFTHTQVREFLNEGSLGTKVSELCGQPAFPAERAPLYQAVEQTPHALLDDAAPEIILVGTSNSNLGQADHAYFAGAIREESGLDVLNLGVVAGGVETSMLLALQDRQLWEHPPRILVWEATSLANFATEPRMRQFVAELQPPCTAENALAEGSGKADGQPILTVDPALGLAGGQTYLFVDGDPGLLSFRLRLSHGEKVRDVINITRVPRVAHTGDAAVLLSDRIQAPLTEVRVESLQEGFTPPVTLRVCKVRSAAEAAATLRVK